MRHLIALLATFIVAIIPASAQYGNAPAPYGITDASYLTAFPGEIEIPGPNAKRVKAAFTITVSTRSGGGTEYSIDAGSVSFSGDMSIVAGMTAAQLFDLIAAHTVVLGLDEGYATCPQFGSASTGVTVHSCVTRTSSGLAASGTNANRRAYSFTCASTTLTGATGATSCGLYAEATYSGGGLQ